MFGTEDFTAFLTALAAIAAAPLTDAERADALAVIRGEFLGRAHDPRLMAIVDRLTTPAPVVVAAPAPARGKRAAQA